MKGFFRLITFLFFVAIALLATLFVGNNTTEVSLWIGMDLAPTSVGALIVSAFIIGGLLGLLLGMGLFRRLKYHFEIRQLKARLEKAEKGISQGRHSHDKSSR